ncbi:MAG: hypothetical protein R2684_15110 [Pyrinomonadaceae bacterium]
MLGFITSLFFAFAGDVSWHNYPGFELWRFLNLGIFVAIIYFLLRKPLSGAFKQKRESIRAELIKAEEEKEAAAATLARAEAKLENLPAEKESIMEDARNEASAEKARLAGEAENDIRRLNDQADSEISRKAAQVMSSLKKFSAEESIRLAEEKIRGEMNIAKDSELVKANIASIGGLNK